MQKILYADGARLRTCIKNGHAYLSIDHNKSINSEDGGNHKLAVVAPSNKHFNRKLFNSVIYGEDLRSLMKIYVYMSNRKRS